MEQGSGSHSRRRFSVASIALAVALILGGASAARGWTTSGDSRRLVRGTSAEGRASSAQSEAATSRFGVQLYGGTIRDEELLGYVADAGAGIVRWPCDWASVEPSDTTPDHYDWTSLDSAVTKAADHGLELLMTIAGQPAWAAEYAMGPPYDTADLVEYVGALVERYDGDGVDDAPGSPVVRRFELYNEPENYDTGRAEQGGYGYWGNNGEGYAELLQTLYPVVKGANPEAQLVFGGLAMDWCYGGGFDCGFLDDALAACEGHDCFDVMNFHYFPYYRDNWEAYGPDIIGKATYVRQRLSAYGFGDKPVICSETTWPSATTTSLGSDERQSRYVAKGWARGLAAELETVAWFWLLDGGDPNKRGLLDKNRQPKPSYLAYQTMTSMLGGATFERALTSADTGSTQLEGYRFKQVGSGRWLDVVWTEDGRPYNAEDEPIVQMTVPAESLRSVDKFGSETWVHDEDDGAVDGQITLQVGGSPLYLFYAEAPDAAFQSSSPDWLGQTTTFTNTTAGEGAIAYSWDLGDGETSSLEHPTHAYTEGGSYTVVLTATNDAGEDVTSGSVIVFGPPQIALTTSSPDFLGQTTTFTASVTTTPPGDPSVELTWDFGDGTVRSGEPTTEHTYDSPGTYTVEVMAENPAGQGVATDTVTILSRPTAAFLNSSPDWLGQTTTFTNTSAGGGPITYDWDFGDGATSDAESPTHVYAEAGSYTVVLTATNDAGQDVTSGSVTVFGPPQVALTTSSPDSLGQTTTFTASVTTTPPGDPSIELTWDFGNGTVRSGEPITEHTYASPGTYTVEVMAENPAGQGVATDTVTICSKPAAAFTTSSPDWLGETTTFTNTSGGGGPITYDWDFGDGATSDAESPTHAYAEAGTYTVVLTATNAAGEDVTSGSVTVFGQPQVGVSTSSPDFLGQTTTFIASVTTTPPGDPSVELTWDFGDGTVRSGEMTTEHTYASTGTYTVVLTATNAAGEDVTTDTVAICSKPAAAFTTSSPDWLGEITTFNNATAGEGPMTYRWDFGDGSSSALAQPTHAYAEAGSYMVVLTATNDAGQDVTSGSVTVFGLPQVSVSTSSPDFLGQTTTFTANVTTTPPGDPSVELTWDFGDGTVRSGEATTEHTYPSPGTYTVEVTVENLAGGDVATDTVSIYSRPAPAFITSSPDWLGQTTTFTNTTSCEGPMTYSWDFGDGATSDAESPTHAYAEAGSYTVELTATVAGDSEVTTRTVTVYGPPRSDFVAWPVRGAVTLSVTFTALPTSVPPGDPTLTYRWDFGDGATSAAAEPEHVYEAAGIYTVTLEVTNAAGTDQEVKTSYIVVEMSKVYLPLMRQRR